MWSKLFILILGLSLFACHNTQSQQVKPEKVYRIVYEVMPDAWYKKQAELWQKEIEKNPKNPEAWYNFYNANRYAAFDETIGQPDKKARLKKIIEDMARAIPGTYEQYLLTYWDSYDLHDLSLIEKAYRLAPDRPDTYYPFISHFKINGQTDKVNEFCQKLYDSQDIAPWLLSYNYNVLMSTEKNAILFTNGDNDTYPIWLLQAVQGIRPDVTILNISLATIDDYLKQELKKKQIQVDIEALKKKAIVKDQAEKQFSPGQYACELAQTIIARYPEFPVYFAVTVYPSHIKAIQKDLYIVGLAYQYSPERIDNIAWLKKHLNDFRLDYLNFDWYQDKARGESIKTNMHMNYIVPMTLLAEHYKTSGDETQAGYWKRLAVRIAQQAGNKEALAEIEKKGI